MKTIRVLLSLIIVMAILFAFTLSVCAIGFEAEDAYESVFVIYSGNAMGSGFALGENCIVTNAHVIENNKHIYVTTYEGTEYQAIALDINEDEDIAVLVVKDAKFPCLAVADLSTIKTGDDIYAIGAPKGMTYTLTKGGISAKERTIRNYTYIQIDAPINEGNSGGPLLNDAGEVIGMNTFKMSDSEGIGLAIPIVRICSYLETLGIDLNAEGNVSESIVLQKETSPESSEDESEENKTDDYDDEKLPVITYISFAVAGVSLIVNIIQTVFLIYQKKKNLILKYNPKERTDFDIDILE